MQTTQDMSLRRACARLAPATHCESAGAAARGRTTGDREMRTSRLLGGLRSRRVRVGTAAAIAVLGAVATVELTAAFVASPPPAIAGQAPAATAADPNCSGLITLVCGSESRNETYGGTNSFSQSKSGSSGGTQSVSQSGGGSEHNTAAKPHIVPGTVVSAGAGASALPAQASCGANEVATGGGYRADAGLVVLESSPGLSPGGGQGWKVIVNNPTGGPLTVLAYAVCQAV